MAATNTQSRPTRSFEEVNREILARLDILAEYRALGVTFVSDRPRASGKISCYARGRDESHPSAYVDVNTGRYGDSGGESPESLSLWDFAAKYGGGKFADWKAARRHYADVAGVAIGKSKAAEGEENPAEALEFIPWSAGEERLARLWCAKHKPGVTLVALKLAGARIAFYHCWADKKTGQRHRGHEKVIALPCYGEQLTAADPVAWVVWNINGSPLKVFRGKDKPHDLVKMKSIGPTWGTLGNLQALERLASVAENSDDPESLVVWKTEGPTDGLALLGILPPAVRDAHLVTWNFSGSIGDVPPHVVATLAGHKVAIVHDADAGGEAGAKKWGEALAGVTPWTRQVRLPYPIEPKRGKDLRHWIVEEKGEYGPLCQILADAQPLEKQAAQAVGAESPSTSTIGPAPSANGQHASRSPTSEFRSKEADDDPHRLARLHLDHDAGRHPDGLTLHYWREEWWQFHQSPHAGGRYIPLKEAEIKSRITSTCKAEFDRINVDLQAERANKDGEIPATLKVTRSLIHNVLGALQGDCLVASSIEQPAWLEPASRPSRPNFVAMANGILCLDSLFAALGAGDAEKFTAGPGPDGQLPAVMRPHSPRWFSTVCLPYPFDGAAECPRFLAFLAKNLEGDAERIAVLQEFAGYLLTPDTSYQKFLVLEGEGANGKSVFCAVLEAMLGRENVSHVQLELFAQRFALTPTLGKLANVAAEVGELDKVAEGFVKSFTSGDRMQFDRKHISAVDATPTARLVIATNNRPRFSDRSSGIWRRMLLVPWQVQIAEAQRVLGMDKPEWWEASGELPGIFNWAVAGLWRLRQQHRFTRSAVCESALDEYRSEVNPARSFLLDSCTESESCEIGTAELYHQYKQWCEANGYRTLGERVFGKEVRRVFPSSNRQRTQKSLERNYAYLGIGYRHEHEMFR